MKPNGLRPSDLSFAHYKYALKSRVGLLILLANNSGALQPFAAGGQKLIFVSDRMSLQTHASLAIREARMANYFYDLQGAMNSIDHEGIDFRRFEEARLEAVRYFAEVIDSCAETFSNGTDLQLTVRDERSAGLLTFNFSMRETLPA